MNPEQHYGVLAMEPERRLGETLAQRRAAWDTVPRCTRRPTARGCGRTPTRRTSGCT
jgi:hypothetical protein